MWAVLIIAIICPVILIFLLYIHTSRNKNYWKIRGVPFIRPTPFFGNLYELFTFKTPFYTILKNIYFEKDVPYIGIFIGDRPALLIKDLNLYKSIMIKDFDKFTERNWARASKHDIVSSQVLFLLGNPHWSRYRKKLTATFTSGRIKNMFDFVSKTGDSFQRYIGKTIGNEGILDSKNFCYKYSTEVTTSISYGIKAGCFEQNSAELNEASNRMFDFTSFWRIFSSIAFVVSPLLVKLLRLTFIDNASINLLKSVFVETIKEREENNYVRGDLVDILVEMKKQAKLEGEDNFDNDKLLAQAVQFYLAGFETTGSTISFCFYELAKNSDVQSKLRNEVREVFQANDSLNYAYITSHTTYLDSVVKETLRMYPPLAFLDRKCIEDYQLPGSDLILEKGIGVYISLLGMHYDPKLFHDPEIFMPERFSTENVNDIHPLSYLPFGTGPRNCLGTRFGEMSVKSAVANVILNYEIELCDKSPRTLEFLPSGFFLAPKGGKLYLRFKKVVNK